MRARAAVALIILLGACALSACASFNDPDDDPLLCENGRHPEPNGDCPNPSDPRLLLDEAR
jgi:hypothetical protein